MQGLNTKNGKQRAECLDEIGLIIRDYGLGVLQPSATACLKELAKFIGERDAQVRNAAINAITEAFFQVRGFEKVYLAPIRCTDVFFHQQMAWLGIFICIVRAIEILLYT